MNVKGLLCCGHGAPRLAEHRMGLRDHVEDVRLPAQVALVFERRELLVGHLQASHRIILQAVGLDDDLQGADHATRPLEAAEDIEGLSGPLQPRRHLLLLEHRPRGRGQGGRLALLVPNLRVNRSGLLGCLQHIAGHGTLLQGRLQLIDARDGVPSRCLLLLVAAFSSKRPELFRRGHRVLRVALEQLGTDLQAQQLLREVLALGTST
mmetsp:Transcript_20467/g.61690  ORF Transcript_20467/g.61690 Transcript_20467/m.61690 type:complete len:208 (-) Transcript_20467:411-1034(-)